MTKRPTILTRILARLARRKPTKPESEKPAPERQKRRTESSFEPLEGRIAPAVLLNASTVQYKDAQGDLVTVAFSKALFNPGSGLDATLDRVFKFDTGNARASGNTDIAQTLQTLDLTGVTTVLLDQLNSPANGVSVTISAEVFNNLGDGLADVGYLKASQSALNGLVLGKVSIEGDLGRIDAGTAQKAVALKSLIVNSLGSLGTTTQATGGNLSSTILGAVGSLIVNQDVKDAILKIENGNVVNDKALPGNLGKLSIGGKLHVTANLAIVNAGSISVDGNIGSISIGTLPSDGIYGGSSQGSGRIHAVGSIGPVAIKGDIRGSAGKDSGELAGDGGIGDVTLQFSIFAGTGENSGRIVSSAGSIGKVSVYAIRGETGIDTGSESGDGAGAIFASTGIKSLSVLGGTTSGNIRGGAGDASGVVTTATGSIGKVSISGGIFGGAGLRSGRVFAGGSISSALVGGLTGGAGNESGVLRAGDDLGTIHVGFLTGGTGSESGVIRATNDIASLIVDKVITGGTGRESGSIRANNLASLLVKNGDSLAGAIVAGTGIRSGFVGTGATAGKIVLTGSLVGSTTSALEAAGSISIGTDLGSLIVTHSVTGGVAEATGAVVVNGKAGRISVGDQLTGAAGNYSGSIVVSGSVGAISLSGSMMGGSGLSSGSILAGVDFSGPGNVKTITVGGTITGGSGVNSGVISASGVISKITIFTPDEIIHPVLVGGTGGGSGSIYAEKGLGTVSLFGNIVGHDGFASGTIRAGGIAKAIIITGGITGGVGEQSGSIRITDSAAVPGTLTRLKMGTLFGGSGNDSGQILADGTIASATLGQTTGSSGLRTGSILAGFGNLTVAEGTLKLGGIASLKINGGIQAAAGAESGSIIAAGSLKSVTVAGAMTGSIVSAGRTIGSLTANSLQGVHIRAIGQAVQTKTDIAIQSLIVLGNVDGSEVLAGYDRYGNATNGDAQIGKVFVKENWNGSSMAAGVADVGGDGFGSADDAVIPGSNAAIFSKIASVIIGKNATGRADASQVGFVAQQIDFMSINGVKQLLTAEKNAIVLTTSLNEITIREVA